MASDPYRTTRRAAESGSTADRLDVDGVLSAVALLVAGIVALLSGLVVGAASEGGLGVALLIAAIFMLRGELRAAGLRERCGSSATPRSR